MRRPSRRDHISGIDKQQVGQVAAEIRALARPSPTRARASNTPTSSSSARKARRSNGWRSSLSSIAAAARVRTALRAKGSLRPSAAVGASLGKHIYAQVIDDAAGRDAGCRVDAGQGPCAPASGGDIDGAAAVGKRCCRARAQAGVKEVVFDRGGYCSTAASRRSPTPPAKAGWSSKWLTKPKSRPLRRKPPLPPPRASVAAVAGVADAVVAPVAIVAAVAATAIERRDDRRGNARSAASELDRQARPHQPRGQGGEGRQALRLRSARRRRRPEGPGRLRPRQGARSAGSDPQGDRRRQEGDGPRSAARRPHAAPRRRNGRHGAGRRICAPRRRAPASSPAARCAPCSKRSAWPTW
jgi:large subunit ribosomal protein L18